MAEQMSEMQLNVPRTIKILELLGHTTKVLKRMDTWLSKTYGIPEELYHPLPPERGQMNWWGRKMDQFTHSEVEMQVEGSLARYWHPQYREIHCWYSV
jgi:hypothetical protein